MYVAVDIGGTKTLLAAYSENGELLRTDKHPTEKNFDRFIEQLPSEIEAIADGEPVDGVAVAAPAVVDYDDLIAKAFGNLDWKNVDIVSPLKYHFGDAVYFDNDANMGALGEANMGAGQGHEKVLYVTLSTGIGTGVTVNGQLSPALRESEGGMMRFQHDGKLEEWEDFASGRAFVEQFGQYGADDDNPEHWQEWAKSVSVGMIDMIALIQPDAVVIGGSMGVHIKKYHDFLHSEIQNQRGKTVAMPVLVGAKDPDNAVINGCFVTCQQNAQS